MCVCDCSGLFAEYVLCRTPEFIVASDRKLSDDCFPCVIFTTKKHNAHTLIYSVRVLNQDYGILINFALHESQM